MNGLNEREISASPAALRNPYRKSKYQRIIQHLVRVLERVKHESIDPSNCAYHPIPGPLGYISYLIPTNEDHLGEYELAQLDIRRRKVVQWVLT